MEYIGDSTTFAEYEQLIEAFEEALNSVGIEIDKKGLLNQICLEVINLSVRKSNPEMAAQYPDMRIVFRELVGLIIPLPL